MSTETIINIERRESGCSTWHPFDVSNIPEDAYQRQMKLWQSDYPQHHFRAVKITTTREVLK